MANTLKIRKFPIDDIKIRKNILIIGKRGTGKTTLVKDILYNIRKKVNTVYAMCPTYETQQIFESILPKSHVYDEYSIETIRNIISTMTSLNKQKKERDVGLILDDCMFEKGIMKTKEMREIHMNGRHLHLWFINSVQYLMDIGPDIRTQIDYVFALKENNASNRHKLHQYFFGIFDRYDEFCTVFDSCTNNRECLVLDNTQVNNKVEDSVYYYKANPDIGNFRVGDEVYFKLDRYFSKSEDQQNSLQTKLPDPVKTKTKINYVEKIEDEEDSHKDQPKKKR